MHGGGKHIHSIDRPRHPEDSWRNYSILDSGRLDYAIISTYLMHCHGRVGERATDGKCFDGGLGMAKSDRKGTRTYTKVLISVAAADRPSQYIMHASTGVLWCGPRMHTAGRQERRRSEDMEWDGVDVHILRSDGRCAVRSCTWQQPRRAHQAVDEHM